MRIKTITCHNVYNFGASLQAYALASYLKSLGHEVEIIDYIPVYLEHYKLSGSASGRYDRPFVRQIYNIAKFPGRLKARLGKRKKEYDCFTKKYLPVTQQRYSSNEELKRCPPQADVFFAGSDQIWNPYYLSVACLLKFVSDNKKKISYATSVGVSSIPNDLKKVYKKNLSRFDSLSVREETAAELLTEVVGREIEVVADPTFLLSKEALTNIASEDNADAVKATNGEKFIFCYFIGANQDWVKAVKKLSEQTGCKVINAMTESRIIPDVGKSYAHFGMSDFLWLIKNATYVCTDSFHCTALSVNMEKEFFVFKRFLDTDTNSQNSRLYSLLKRFDLDERLVTNDDNINEKAKREINYSAVTKKLKEIESQSEDYLKASLTKQ